MSSGSSPRRVQDKVALITGAGAGIGRAAAILMAAEGASVVVADIDSQAADSCAREVTDRNGGAVSVKLEVADTALLRTVKVDSGEHDRRDANRNCGSDCLRAKQPNASRVYSTEWISFCRLV